MLYRQGELKLPYFGCDVSDPTYPPAPKFLTGTTVLPQTKDFFDQVDLKNNSFQVTPKNKQRVVRSGDFAGHSIILLFPSTDLESYHLIASHSGMSSILLQMYQIFVQVPTPINVSMTFYFFDKKEVESCILTLTRMSLLSLPLIHKSPTIVPHPISQNKHLFFLRIECALAIHNLIKILNFLAKLYSLIRVVFMQFLNYFHFVWIEMT